MLRLKERYGELQKFFDDACKEKEQLKIMMGNMN